MAVPRILLVVTAVAAVLVGSGALARTLPFRPIALPAPTDGGRETAPSVASGADAPERGAESSENEPATPPPTAGVAAAEPDAEAPPAEDPAEPPATEAPVPAPITIEYEAEQADLSGFVRLFEVEQASAGNVVGMIGPDETSSVRFPEVTVDTAGEYELTLFYVSGPDRQAMVTVNESAPLVLEFPGLGGESEVGEVSLPVDLAAGANVIWFGNVDRPAPALDRITVTG